MQIKDMFVKPIDRDLQGVIIVGQGEETNVSQELEEYVVTRMLNKHFADFFEAYKKGIKNNTNEVGVWISGFFGSGKSHLLKILSYLLANKEVDGKRAIDYFIDDNKIDDAMLLADMKLAADTPADVILFNIDSKSDSNGKQNKDSIVNVFLKVFNEMQGLCGNNPFLADLEGHLIDEGKYDDFKNAIRNSYQRRNKDVKEWEEARNYFDFIQDQVVEALDEIGAMSEDAAMNWCEKATETYKISIEDFAKRVKKYIDKKGDDRHVVFMVDEVGQYIGDDSNLMLNLQTVREELGKECKGKAWVIVTSQQDIDSVIKVKGNDFSKIQGRFATRLSLSSANVDEVIKKRILEKNETGAQTLRVLYEQNETSIKNLLEFREGGAEKKKYTNANNFAEVYPFVPYQFDLLSAVLTSIRTHGASGKHLSEGERSMLALFKESADRIKTSQEGAIVPFYMFYDALDSFLDHSHRSVIIRAYDNSEINPEGKTEDVFAINLLKTLFMIKYVKEVDANIDNLTTLMVSNINDDRIKLKTDVEEALKILQKQTLIQKNGDIYIFLTNEEQEISNEINNINVEIGEVINKVSEMVFEDIYQEKRYRYPEFNGRYTFAFNQIVDDRPYKTNQNHPIGLRIITPWYEGGTDEITLKLVSGQNNEVIVALPDDSAFLDELLVYLKIEKFLRLNSSGSVSKYEEIKEAKRKEMKDRGANAKLYLKEALKDAIIYVNGDIPKLSSKDEVSKINEALGKVVQTVYNKLEYITFPASESDVRKLFVKTNQLTLDLENEDVPNKHALDDVFQYINNNTRMHMKTSMKLVKDRFQSAPYGFVEDDVYWLVAYLFKNGDLSFTVNGEITTLLNRAENEILDYITKKSYIEKLLIEVRIKVSDKERKALKNTIKEVFGYSLTNDDEDYGMKEFAKCAEIRINEMDKIEMNFGSQSYSYPGKKVIEEGKQLLSKLLNIKEPKEFYKYVFEKQDDLCDYADDYEPVKKFFLGEQKDIFTGAVKMLEIYDDSKTYIVNKELEDIVHEMKTIVMNNNPYKDIPKLPDLRKRFIDTYHKILVKEKEPVKESINNAKERVVEKVETKEYVSEKKSKYISLFIEISDDADRCNNISTLRSYMDKAETLKIRLLNEMDDLDEELARQKAQQGKDDNGNNDDIVVKIPVKKTKNITIKNITHTSSWRIESVEDIESHLSQLRESLIKELDETDIVNVEF
ncbi:BREX system P-loop protein BrxC [uncultured Eubacterium sp.]|uniref:BREX system P-loop protein BrxC n=1 Tax=uncultured Eubacterium sp. TaxID=165185 RepID=UPI0025995432|nr:BREX system P-loop protein BrxC [uncultured Eubacterium sp.]